ncbi:MAG TPA: ArsC/Spx/MgsR family protein [Bacillota bacterium]|nr:ArsC/Spx/MgsR family protein [Bacillota bacterium]
MKVNYRDILKESPTVEELFDLAGRGGISVTGLVNPRSRELKKLKVSLDHLLEREAAELLSRNPKVMYRPLLTDGKRLVVGFKPEQMEKLIG